jgi:enediyne biosynthesis protein E4
MMRLPIVTLTALCFALNGAAGLTQTPCTSSPVSLVEIGDSTSTPYIGITFKYSQGTFPHELARAGGITVGDFDNDGLSDFVLPGGVAQAMVLARNLGNGQFADVAVAHGLTNTSMRQSAAVLVDYDHDGDLDILVGAHAQGSAGGLIRLFRNAGSAGNYAFHDVSAISGLAFDPGTVEPTTNGHCSGITVGDYNGDGYLDLFIAWWNVGLSSPQNDMWRLFLSQPNTNPSTNDPSIPTNTPRKLLDSTVAAGLNINLDLIPDVDGGPVGGEAWQPSFVDLDHDGWPDLHVCVDFGADFMFMNNRDGTFTDRATAIGLNGNPPQVRNEMGASFADVDNDGDLDVHVTNIAAGELGSTTDPKVYKDRFYRNDSWRGRLRFVDMGPVTGVNNSEYGWGTIGCDLDNDGDLDQATVSGQRIVDEPFINRLHFNLFPQRGADSLSPRYCDATSFFPTFNHGPLGDDVSRNIATLDFEGDGDLDLIVGNSTDTTSVVPGKRFEFFRNDLALANDWLAVDLVNSSGSLDTVHSRLWLRAAGRTQHRQILAGSGFHCQESARQHFGLGAGGGSTVRWLIIRWPGPNGSFQYVTNLTANQVSTINRSSHNWLGDVDVDGKVDLVDLHLLMNAIQNPGAFAAANPDWPGYVLGDIDGDGDLNQSDVGLLLQRHGTGKK